MKQLPPRRGGYYYRNNNKYRSITTLLGETLPKIALEKWKINMAIDTALEFADKSRDEVKTILKQRLLGDANRGTFVHRYIESKSGLRPEPHTVSNEQGLGIPDKYKGYTRAVDQWWSSSPPKTVLYSERVVYSDTLRVAGRLDAVMEIGGKSYLVDFKTNRTGAIFREAGLQVAFYQHALWEDLNIMVDGTMIVCFAEDGSYNVKYPTDTIDDFKVIHDCWKWLKRKE